jgi:hypothetical protein
MTQPETLVELTLKFFQIRARRQLTFSITKSSKYVGGDCDMKFGTGTEGAFCSDCSAMHFRDPAGNRQPQSRTASVPGSNAIDAVKPVKDVL